MVTDLNVETTTQCNRRCDYCPNSVFDRGLAKNERLFPWELWKKLVDELADYDWRGRLSPHSYGEPLVDSRLADFISYAHARLPKAALTVWTNGDFLDDESYTQLSAAGISAFHITLHGGRPSAKLTSLLEAVGGGRPGAARLFARGALDDVPNFNRGGLVRPKRVNFTPRCWFPDSPVVVNVEGDVVLCCNDYHGTNVFGNVREGRLLDIWKRPSFRSLRDEIRAGEFRRPICRACVGLPASEAT